MRTAGLGLTLGIAIALVATAAPGPAAAAPGYHVVPAGHVIRFQLEGSNGYRIWASANHRRFVSLKTQGAGVTSRYEIRGRRTELYGIDTKLAGLGLVDMTFAPNGRERHLAPYPNCDGPGSLIKEGVVRGRFRFRAEGGYTRAEAHRVKAEVLSWSRQRCRYLEPGRSRGPKKLTASFAAFSSRSSPVDFRAIKYSPRLRPPARRVVFTASTGSRRGRLWISRSARAVAGVGSFRVPNPTTEPEHIVLAPPRPFSGTASFHRTPESTFSWEGSLAVEFPAIGKPFALTGPSYDTSYCALRSCVGQDGEDESSFSAR